MTTAEARELIIDGINYAAYRETDSSLHDSDKNRFFGSEHYKSDSFIAQPSPVGRRRLRGEDGHATPLGERT